MSIIETVTVSSFRDAFSAAGRADSFSYEGLGHLFEYLEEFSDGMGEPIELDPIGCCGDFNEYESAMDALEEYVDDKERKDIYEECEDDDEREDAAVKYFQDQTGVVHAGPGCFMIEAF